MISRPFLRVAVACTMLITDMATSAAAQDTERPLEPMVGYIFTHGSQGGVGENFPIGFSLQASRDLRKEENRAIAVVGGFDWSRANIEGVETDHLMHFLGGVRLKLPKQGITPYVEGLAGLARLTAKGAPSNFAFDFSENGFSWSGGAGVIIPVRGGKGRVHLSFNYGSDNLSPFRSEKVGVGYEFCPFCASVNSTSGS